MKESTVEEWDTIMGWLNGVSIHEFINENASGSFQGREYTGAELTAAEYSNHVPAEHEAWVDSEVQKLVYQGGIAEWLKVANVSDQPRPRMVMPLGIEPNKPRLIYDARWLNLMCRHVPFAMDSVGREPDR